MYTVARSVTFYEQSLVDAMRISIGKAPSVWTLLDVGANDTDGPSQISDVQSTHTQGMEEDGAQINEGSSTELFLNAQLKLTEVDGQTSLVSSKTLRTPGMKKPAVVDIQPSHNKQKAQGKYSRLRRELFMAMRAGYNETVCVVTVVDETTDCSEKGPSRTCKSFTQWTF